MNDVYGMLFYAVRPQNAPSKWHTYTTQHRGNLHFNDTLVDNSIQGRRLQHSAWNLECEQTFVHNTPHVYLDH